jgi:hypothetical protein
LDALILNGALAGDAELDGLEAMLRRELSAAGCRSEAVVLRETPIAYCQGCFECWIKTPGMCKTQDAGRDIAAAVIRSDLLVLLSPITFGGYSSELKKALDRSIGLVLPFFTRIDGEVHHRPRYDRFPALLAVGVLPEPHAEEERIFQALVARNARNMHSPWHAVRVLYRGEDGPTRLELLRPLLEQIGRAA